MPHAKHLFASCLLAALLFTTGVQAAVVATSRHGAVFEVLTSQPNRIQRYDSASRTWLSPTQLPASEVPRAMVVEGDGVLVAFDRVVYRYRFDGTAPTHVANVQ